MFPKQEMNMFEHESRGDQAKRIDATNFTFQNSQQISSVHSKQNSHLDALQQEILLRSLHNHQQNMKGNMNKQSKVSLKAKSHIYDHNLQQAIEVNKY